MFLLIDGNNVAWAGFYALARSMGADTPEQKRRAALAGLTASVVGMAARGGEPPDATPRPGAVTSLAIAFDQGRPLRRRAVFPTYQTGRESDPGFMENEQHVVAAIEQFIDAARVLPIAVMRGSNTEADDLAAAAVLRHPGKSRIASTDRDFLQLVDDRVSIYSTVKRVVIDAENFAEHAAPRDSAGAPVAFPREHYLDYRAASGDTSDDLPGIPGVGALTAARLVARHPLDAYLARPALVSEVLGRRNVRVEGAIRSGEAATTVARNRRLMDLRLAAAGFADLAPYTRRGRWDEGAFRGWIAELRLPMVDVAAASRAFATIEPPPP